MQWNGPIVLVSMSSSLPRKARNACSEAIKWWATKGVRYLQLEIIDDSRLTPGKPWPGHIQVLNADPPDGSSGFTQVHHNLSGNIDSAELRVSCKWYRAQTFAHELGHALGLGHTSQRENLMFTETSPGRSGLTPSQLKIVI